MTENITLPREVVEQLLKMLEMVEPYADQFTDYSSTAAEWPLNLLPEKVGVAITALRKALAAEPTKQEPGLMEGLTELARQMKPLDADMAAILHDNLDSLYIEDEPALAAEQPKPKQEPVAWQCREHGDDEWFDCSKEAYGINPSRYVYRRLYTAPPALAAEQPKHDLMKWAKDAGSSPEDLERFATYTIATRDMEIATLREENEALRRENERLREALKLAFTSHGRMLMSDPPQDAWKFNRVDEVIVAALRREGT